MLSKLFCALTLMMASQASLTPDTVLVRVGQKSVSVADFRETIIAQRRTADSSIVMESFTEEGQRRTLQHLVDARLLAEGARERKLDSDPSVRRAVARAVDGVLADSLIRVEVDRLDLSDTNLQHYYDLHQEQFRTDRRVKARHIVVATRADAEEIERELASGADFGDIAAQRNTDSSKSKRGELGWINRGVMVKPFEEALFSLRGSETSSVVQTFLGFHIIQVEEIDPGKLMPFASVRDRVRQQIIQQQVDEVKRELATKYPISVDEAAFKEALR
jgi:peptidyl-prolyl cis-trans isomerase C